jgi:pyruvate dehydrogenase E2 component (dihydrolipoamide acetyltransferase)
LISVIGEEGVIAKPPIRKLAKDLGVDISTLTPSGMLGEVTREDVVTAATQASVFRNLSTPAAPSAREERIPVKGIRKAIASAMVQSAFTAPHVSIFVDVDATRTMEYVKRLKASTDFAGVKVTPLLIMAKAMIWAVRRNPTVNSTWTDEEIIVHNFVNFGIAAATPRGLIVPNIKDADKMSMLELAKAKTAVEKTGKIFAEFGSAGGGEGTGADANAELLAKAAELRKTKPELTEAQAFDKVYNDPSNRELAQRERTERLTKIHRAA